MGCQCTSGGNEKMINIDNIINDDDPNNAIISSFPLSDYTKKVFKLINKINIFLPENNRCYGYYDLKEIDKNKKNKKIEYNINNNKNGAFIKGGEIITKKMRLRRSIQK